MGDHFASHVSSSASPLEATQNKCCLIYQFANPRKKQNETSEQQRKIAERNLSHHIN